jgi:two-component system, chemotaxis family, protein-glutamate methylesterase/glutaminase
MPSTNDNNARPAHLRRLRSRINRQGMKRDVVVIGASAGGVSALIELFAALPSGLAAVIGVVLHRSAAPGELARVLGRRSALPITEPIGRMRSRKGNIYLAPPDHHLLFEDDSVLVQRGPKEHSTRPAIDPLFRSAAAAYDRRVIGILLTGCGEDGVSGLIGIAEAGGLTLAQDPSDAYMPYLPRNALQFDRVAAVFPLRDMADAVDRLVRGRPLAAGHKPRRSPRQRSSVGQ